MSPLRIDGQGRLPLPPQTARDLGQRPLELVSASDRHLLLGSGEGEDGVLLAGRLGDIGVADLLSFCNMFRKSGVLRFCLQGGTKDLFFQNGDIVAAASTFPEEELGEILCSQGKISRARLLQARQFSGGRKDFGQLLVEKGAVTRQDLWLAIRQQAEGIVYHLFTFHQGSFAFWAGSSPLEEGARLAMSTQNLIMEGLRRVDERALFLRRLGSLDALVVPTGGSRTELLPGEQRLLARVREQQRTVHDLLRHSGPDDFAGLRLLYQLLDKGAVRLEDAPSIEVTGELGELLGICNGALAALFRRVREVNDDFDQEVRVFLRDLPQPYSYVFRDVRLRDDGSLDGGRILANLAGLEEADKLKLLADALNELIFMECMAARRDLGSAESAELIRRVQNVTGRVRTLIGRME